MAIATEYFRVEKFIAKSEPAIVVTGRHPQTGQALGYRVGYAKGWHAAGEYLDQVQAEDHGRDLVRRGFEARVQQIQR